MMRQAISKIKRPALTLAATSLLISIAWPFASVQAQEANIDFPAVKLRLLDKTTARTMTLDADVGSTIKFGEIYLKVQSCRKTPEMEKPEAASFLQVWEIPTLHNEESGELEQNAQWIFSGWMFASSPGLSSMDHPIYDVWVLDCLEKASAPEETNDTTSEDSTDEIREGEGVIKEEQAPEQPQSDAASSTATPVNSEPATDQSAEEGAQQND